MKKIKKKKHKPTNYHAAAIRSSEWIKASKGYMVAGDMETTRNCLKKSIEIELHALCASIRDEMNNAPAGVLKRLVLKSIEAQLEMIKNTYAEDALKAGMGDALYKEAFAAKVTEFVEKEKRRTK